MLQNLSSVRLPKLKGVNRGTKGQSFYENHQMRSKNCITNQNIHIIPDTYKSEDIEGGENGSG